MYKNYFYLNRMITELNPIFTGMWLTEAFSQEKDRLILNFTSNGNDKRILAVSTDQNLPYINLRKEYCRAKKNTAEFFFDHLPDSLINIEIATDDRIIRFNFTRMKLYFMIRGKDTNIILTDETGCFEPFKKIKPDLKEKIVSVINEKLYSPYFHKPEPDLINDEQDFQGKLKKLFPFIGKEILAEALARAKGNTDFAGIKFHLTEAINEIKEGIAVFYDDSLNKV
ncbi:MAG: NFACT family protein, partial [Ignavibacteria bacterium]